MTNNLQKNTPHITPKVSKKTYTVTQLTVLDRALVRRIMTI